MEQPVKASKKHALTPEMVAVQWKKGQSGNPKGRVKGGINIWSRVQRQLLEKVAEGDNKGKEFADLVAKSFVKELLKGKWPQTKELLDREEGATELTIKHTGDLQQTVRHVIDYDQLRNDLEAATGIGSASGRISANGNGQPVHPDNAN